MATPQTVLRAAVLTRDEARERAALIPRADYTLTLDLTRGDESFGCEAEIRFPCTQPGAAPFLDLVAPEVAAIELNGRALPLDAFDGERIVLEGLEAENVVRVTCAPAFSRTGNGMHVFRDPVDDAVYCYTDFEPREAHRVYPCFDQPDIKGTFAFTVVARPGWVVSSNTPEASRPGDGEGGRWTFERTKPMSTYLTAVCAGPYHVVRDRHGPIDLGIWCRASLARHLDPDEIFEVTKQGFSFFGELFDYPYPFGKYDQVFVPEFNAGAMENVGCVTFNESMIHRSRVTDSAREGRAGVILHEMAHMWFGDLVTMRWWDDLWLNESFATYMGALASDRATRFRNAWTSFARGTKMGAVATDELPTTHPIVADVADTDAARTNFDGISYSKGASVLKQLVVWVGEEEFAAGIRNYFRRHEYGNADLEAFLAALEEPSGRDLGAWSKEWLETAGVNTIRASFALEGDRYTRFALEQTAAPDHPTLRRHRIAVGLYDLEGGRLVRRRRVDLDVAGESTAVEALVGERAAALVLPNDDDLTYSKIRLDPRSLATLTEHLASLQDPLARALSWFATTDQLRDAELAARDYLRLVLGNVGVETEAGVVGALLARAQQAVVAYGDPANREGALAQIADRARAEMERQPAGGDLQLVWARFYIGSGRRPEDLAFLRALLDATATVEGLLVDTDMRWGIVGALAARGAAQDLIDPEVERDPTDAGQRHALSAKAARPSAEAKAEAWERINDPAVGTATMRALMGGFWRWDQERILAPYVERYFGAIEEVLRSRDTEDGIRFARAMYPSVFPGEDLVARTERYLAEVEPPGPIRRALIESADGVRRALLARACDADAGRRAERPE